MSDIDLNKLKLLPDIADTQTFKIHGIAMNSTLTVVQQSRDQYKQTQKTPDEKLNAEIAHDYASSFARQITREQMERQLHKTGKTRPKRGVDSVEPTYENLFKENWDNFCAQNDLNAIDSPAAYLRALYIFSGQLDAEEKPTRKISEIRPDIATQQIDASSVFEPLPALQLVNKVLGHKIKKHAKHANDKTTLEIMSIQTKPIFLPYHHRHRQCVVALAAKNLGLGILDYKLQLLWPNTFFQNPDKVTLNLLCEAQIKMSNLSNRQIDVLTAKLAEYISPTDTETGATHSVVDKFSIQEDRYDLNLFASQTNCWPSQIKQFVDLQVSKSYPSSSSHLVVDNVPGSKLKTISLTHDNPEAHMVTALDRIQRMIRFHKWSNISLGELDTLVYSAISSDGSDTFIPRSTLRAVGVYQYFNQHYGIEAEEFAALLYRLPTDSVNGRASLFDRVFHRGFPAANLFKKEEGSTEVSPVALADGMDLQMTQESFDLCIRLAKKHLGSLHQNLPTASSLYRQARVARLFGLSPLECKELINLLGGEAFERLLVSGKLSSETEADILHLLMAVDGVMTWLRSAGLTVAQLLRMLGRRLPFAREKLPVHVAAISALRDATAEKQHTLAVHQLLQDVAGLSVQYVPCVMKMANTTEQRICAEIKKGKTLLLHKSLAAAEICQTLNISSDILLNLLSDHTLIKPDWNSAFELQDFYCLERFANYSRHDPGASHELLGFLKLSHTDTQIKANDALAKFLVTKQTLNTLTKELPRGRVENMQQLDWVTRHLELCKNTGLSLEKLRDLLKFNSQNSMDEWRAVAAELLHNVNV
ncbi:Tc toxin subunit A [Pseudomonas sp. A34-9]|uniref:Tc toxin subunit A n=1 Tax=Pseudomonas sp. A34-9 TaxID=3034675 RepID=UPI00240CEB66|nr:Tc toxin subunit A [Pseudomonas sp. A34-9]